MSDERGIPNDSSLENFFRSINEVQERLKHLTKEDPGKPISRDPLTSQILEEMHLLMEELHVAAEELQVQNRELAFTQEKVEEERRKYQDLFHFAPDGYLVTDRHGMILEANQAAGYLFSISPQFLIHKPLAQYVAEDNHKDFRQKLTQLERTRTTAPGRIENWEFTIKPRFGSPVEVSASVTPILTKLSYAEKDLIYRWLIRDIRSQKRIQGEMREMKHELLKSRERERQKLAHNLHEGPVQDLHGVIFQLKPLENDVQQTRQKQSIESIETQLIDIVRKLRLICTDLRPPALFPFGLEKAIRSHAGTFHETHPETTVNLDLEGDLSQLSEEERLVLFQIYEQAMGNIFRHSKAHRVWVRLREEDGKVFMEVEDNGKGFDVPQKWIELVRHHHYGLADAVERAESISGKLKVDSKPGLGTKVRVILQIKEIEEAERYEESG